MQDLPYRARLEDRHGDRWSIQAGSVEQAASIAFAQHATILWVRLAPGWAVRIGRPERSK